MISFKEFLGENTQRNLHIVDVYDIDYLTNPKKLHMPPLRKERIDGANDQDVQQRAKQYSKAFPDKRVEVFHHNPVTGERHETSYARGSFLYRSKR